MEITVTKLSDVTALRRFAAVTTGKPCAMSLAKAYRSMHSIIRTQRFEILMRDIPLFVASQLVRQTQGTLWCMRSKRTDRGGRDFREACESLNDRLGEAFDYADQKALDEALHELWDLPKQFDRYAPTDLIVEINAEALMTMAHKRLCAKASMETRAVVARIREEVEKVDPDLAAHMVPTCIHRGGICPEQNPCGINRDHGLVNDYKKLFDAK